MVTKRMVTAAHHDLETAPPPSEQNSGNIDRRGRRGYADVVLQALLNPQQHNQFLQVRDHVYGRLKEELRKDSHPFHGAPHTIDHVVPAAVILAEKEGIRGEDLLLTATGAVLHDMGFLVKYWNNEPNAVNMANEFLPSFEYTPQQIALADGIVLATQVRENRQHPKTLLEKIMCDADLYNLGGREFLDLGSNLLYERILHKSEIPPEEYKLPQSPEDWLKKQRDFLQNHAFFTDSARQMRDEGKKKNIQRLDQLLAIYEHLRLHGTQ